MSLKEIFICAGKGLGDSLKGIYWLYSLDNVQRRAQQERQEFQELSGKQRQQQKQQNKPSPRHHHGKEEPRLLNRVMQCCTLNGIVFGLSIVLFKSVLLPVLETLLSLLSTTNSTTSTFWSWLQFLLHLTFDGLWVLPLFLLSRIVNALWFQDIGSLAYRYSLGRPKTTQSLSTLIADNLFSLIIQALFLVQALLLNYTLPHLLGGWISALIFHTHTSLLYSLYSFEYKWVQMGMPLHQRLNYLESNWPYFIGFGLPLSILTGYYGDWVVSGCIFAVSFPVFIIAGNEGEVRKWGEASPSGGGHQEGIRLKLFSLVVWISNGIFKGIGRETSLPEKKIVNKKR
ncbi:etoposide-induced protein 2.4 homolog [Folsomia candida]|uniref:etoposide-induced protein 2.4 homolog n=1 Tax=Folsomia candida TaxID=158441 RepID=UPI000B902D29|nr:etoposide-induced protein 2.4 homolog [Folsomia candida]